MTPEDLIGLIAEQQDTVVKTQQRLGRALNLEADDDPEYYLALNATIREFLTETIAIIDKESLS